MIVKCCKNLLIHLNSCSKVLKSKKLSYFTLKMLNYNKNCQFLNYKLKVNHLKSCLCNLGAPNGRASYKKQHGSSGPILGWATLIYRTN